MLKVLKNWGKKLFLFLSTILIEVTLVLVKCAMLVLEKVKQVFKVLFLDKSKYSNVSPFQTSTLKGALCLQAECPKQLLTLCFW